MDECSEKVNQELGNIVKSQREQRNTITEFLKKILEKNSRLNNTKDKISDLHNRIVEITHFLVETLQARREWHNIFKVIKEIPATKNTLPSKTLIHV